MEEQSLITGNECAWQPYRKNTYVDGSVSAIGEKLYEGLESNVKIGFIFAQGNMMVIGTSQRHVMKV